ncbi:hypothetical protein [Methylobacterium sp. ID0610]|uniref:hypothetical protein n=1 Tax=Methylobacterium carpenticola TaxID=3344827 RepID=UPI0036A6F25C
MTDRETRLAADARLRATGAGALLVMGCDEHGCKITEGFVCTVRFPNSDIRFAFKMRWDV